MVRIPVEYQEVEYLESSGTQWINTGISVRVIANAQTTWRLRFSPVTMDRTRIICGANTDEKQVPLMNDGRIRKDWAVSQRTYFSKSISVDSIYSIEQSNGYFSLECSDGDIESEEITKTGSLQDMPFGLFAKITNSEGTSVETTTIAPVKIYGFIAVGDSKICELIPCYRKSDSEPGMYDTVTKQFFTNAGTGTFIVGNDVSWDTANLIERRRQILLNTPHLASESANPLTFQTDISANLKDCKIYFEPVQEGSGDPSPENVRPISGWDGVEIYHHGANLFPLTLPSTAFKGTFSTGSSTVESATNGRVWTMYVGENQNLYYRHGSISPTVMFAFSDVPLTKRTGAVIYNALNCASRNNVLLNSTTHPYLVIAIANSSTLTPETGALDVASAMLSFGNTRKSYEKRTDPSSLTIPFPQTIYGGYVDLVKGEVVEEWDSKLGSELSWTNLSKDIFRTEFAQRSLTRLADDLRCESYLPINTSSTSTTSNMPDKTMMPHRYYDANNYAHIIYVKDSDYTEDLGSFTESVKDTRFAWKLRTPITHQLTPETIKTLKGINNIWSNANGNIELRFWKH